MDTTIKTEVQEQEYLTIYDQIKRNIKAFILKNKGFIDFVNGDQQKEYLKQNGIFTDEMHEQAEKENKDLFEVYQELYGKKIDVAYKERFFYAKCQEQAKNGDMVVGYGNKGILKYLRTLYDDDYIKEQWPDLIDLVNYEKNVFKAEENKEQAKKELANLNQQYNNEIIEILNKMKESLKSFDKKIVNVKLKRAIEELNNNKYTTYIYYREPYYNNSVFVEFEVRHFAVKYEDVSLYDYSLKQSSMSLNSLRGNDVFNLRLAFYEDEKGKTRFDYSYFVKMVNEKIIYLQCNTEKVFDDYKETKKMKAEAEKIKGLVKAFNETYGENVYKKLYECNIYLTNR